MELSQYCHNLVTDILNFHVFVDYVKKFQTFEATHTYV